MKIHPSLVVTAVVVFMAATAAAVYFLTTLLQGVAVLLEIIATALETSP